MPKVTVIGGGSTYTPELIMGFIHLQHQFPLKEIWLMDIDKKRMEIVGSFIQRMAIEHHARFDIFLTTNLHQAVKDASYVITQLRVGGMKARREDEYLGKRHGLIGQETTGIGGMAKALRTIPVILDIANEIRFSAREAILINFANPSGLVTEALFRHAPDIRAVGVCNSAFTAKMELIQLLNQKRGLNLLPDEVQIKTLGLNHLTWYYGLEVGGYNFWPEIMPAIIEEAHQQANPMFEPQLLNALQMLPNSYLRYYYSTGKELRQQDHWPPSRAESVIEIEEELLSYYQNEDHSNLPSSLMSRGGAYYSTIATKLVHAHFNNLDEIHVLNTRHNGSIQGWNPDWVLELPCRVNASGIFPIATAPLPSVCEGLVSEVKAYEIMTAEAAVSGNRDAAFQAILAHPLGPPAEKISDVLSDMLEINHKYLPTFFS